MTMTITSFLILLVAGCVIAASGQELPSCEYSIYVQTGDRSDAGTDSFVTFAIADGAAGSYGLIIPNLEEWGNMGIGHDYFEQGRLDVFSGTSECLSGPPCWMMLAHDSTGGKPGWYVDYVLVIMTGREEHEEHVFRVDQWLAWDSSPYQLMTSRNHCGRGGLDGGSTVVTSQLHVSEAAGSDDGVVAVAARRMGSGGEQQYHTVSNATHGP